MTPERSRLLAFCMHNDFPFLWKEENSAIAERLKETRPALYAAFLDKFGYTDSDIGITASG